MADVEFNFKPHNAWTMGPACGTALIPSVNPAPATTACIYIVHNSTENSTYVGYADNAFDRWKTRAETFHALGIPHIYGNNILCAQCMPVVSHGHSMYLAGQNNCEHLLIRAVVNGLLGPTTSTNTQLGKTPFINAIAGLVRVYLPSDPWGKLEGAKQVALPVYGY